MASNKVILDLRGVRIPIDRDALMELPESVLLCLFPNGVVLSPQRQLRSEGDEPDEGDDVYYVEVSLFLTKLEVCCSASSSRGLHNGVHVCDGRGLTLLGLSTVRCTMSRLRIDLLRTRSRRLLWTTRRSPTRLVRILSTCHNTTKSSLPETSYHSPTRGARVLCYTPQVGSFEWNRRRSGEGGRGSYCAS